MRVLCCLDGTNVEQIHTIYAQIFRAQELTIGLIYVIDSGPHNEMQRQRERFLRVPHLAPPRQEQMHQAEQSTAQDILEEGLHFFPGAELLRREGHPEREIVGCASEWGAQLIIICSRSPRGAGPALGPKSVGHVSRFVLDHAPCPVLLIRSDEQST
ncbi:MAG: universal stress protein [Ktedonobacteraceae bacterium]